MSSVKFSFTSLRSKGGHFRIDLGGFPSTSSANEETKLA